MSAVPGQQFAINAEDVIGDLQAEIGRLTGQVAIKNQALAAADRMVAELTSQRDEAIRLAELPQESTSAKALPGY